ncbi:MAG: response regulator transcription factor [Clostridiales bacterium]|nr:response regulator transcription factor [Clostridiales bacterium]
MAGENILVVDDEVHIVELVKYNLENNGFKVFTAYEGREAINIAETKNINLVILDLMLPDIDGLEVCKTLKRKDTTSNIPIIMLTAKSEELDKIVGLELGADDYITKPFSVRELMARVRAILRRAASEVKGNEVLRIGQLTIDNTKHEVLKNGKSIDLTLKEFELLYLLIKNKGKVLTRDSLLDRVWGYEYYGETRTVDVHVRHLRQKIEDDDKNPKYIETIRGIGYRFNDIPV